MAWERPQADKRWDDLAVAHIDEIAKGLRPREFEKKLVELLDPTLMQAPPSASDRRVSVDMATSAGKLPEANSKARRARRARRRGYARRAASEASTALPKPSKTTHEP